MNPPLTRIVGGSKPPDLCLSKSMIKKACYRQLSSHVVLQTGVITGLSFTITTFSLCNMNHLLARYSAQICRRRSQIKCIRCMIVIAHWLLILIGCRGLSCSGAVVPGRPWLGLNHGGSVFSKNKVN